MASARETAMLGLIAALQATGVTVERNADVPEIIPPDGLVIVAEGDAEIEVILSPLSYAQDLAAVISVCILAVDEPTRDATLDTLLTALSDAITSDRTLGGAVEFADVGSPAFDAFEADGAAKVAQFTVTLSFTTIGSPLA